MNKIMWVEVPWSKTTNTRKVINSIKKHFPGIKYYTDEAIIKAYNATWHKWHDEPAWRNNEESYICSRVWDILEGNHDLQPNNTI